MLNQLMKHIQHEGFDKCNEWEGLDELMMIVRTGSSEAAAAQLQMSREAVLAKVGVLEDRFCQQILHPVERDRLTSTGERIVRRLANVLDELEDFEAEIANRRWFQHGNPNGVLRIGVPHILGDKYVVPALAEFASKHPDLDVEIGYHMGSADLVEKGFDLVIETERELETNHASVTLAKTFFNVCGSPSYFKEFGHPKSPEDLKKHKALLFSQGGQIRPWYFEKEAQKQSILLSPKWYSNSGSALLAAAKNGIGIAYLPDYYLFEDISAGKLQTVLLDWTQTPRNIQIIYLQKRRLPRKVECFVEYISEKFRSFPNAAPSIRSE